MTWSELLKKPSCPLPWDEKLKWIQEATDFGNKYNVIIRLKEYTNRCGEILLIEMTHRNDQKNTVSFRNIKETVDKYLAIYEKVTA